MPIGFIPRMASKVGTAVCGTACTVVCEVAWGTNPHAPTRLLPQQSNQLWGKIPVFIYRPG